MSETLWRIGDWVIPGVTFLATLVVLLVASLRAAPPRKFGKFFIIVGFALIAAYLVLGGVFSIFGMQFFSHWPLLLAEGAAFGIFGIYLLAKKPSRSK